MWVTALDRTNVRVCINLDTGTRIRDNANEKEGGTWIIFPSGENVIVLHPYEEVLATVTARAEVGMLIDAPDSGKPKRRKKLASV